ncbi:SMI1/KNR4 family protein [Streptomyces sp. PR69]|uniref:SMI1/KNR4 family protein n=1 Tax=Streptomyces sp. PR69 TaxID=2984950 RepID=UPI002264AFCB|nr:SMI1/KNR4 family protein [Streptomyces sp. PR69]
MSVEQLAADAGLSAPRRYLVDWERAEAEIGTRLPADYKEYVYWFGPGGFEDYLYICVPGVENSMQELAAILAREQTAARRRAEQFKLPPRVPLFPEPGGWLPWGYTTGGDAVYWVTSSDDPDRWTIAGRPGRGDDFAYFDGGFAAFLHTYVWDTVEMHFLSEAEEDVPIPFEPDDGEWLGGPAERLEAYGRFETEQ